MRTRLFTLLMLALVAALLWTGCEGTEVLGKGTVRPANLSSREQDLLKRFSSQALVYELKVPGSTGEMVRFWIEVYEEGEALDNIMDESVREAGPVEGRVIFTVTDINDEEQFWNFSLPRGSVTTTVVPFPGPGIRYSWVGTREKTVVKGEPFILAVGIYGKDVVPRVTQNVFDGDEEALQELLISKSVYLLFLEIN